MVLEDFNLEAPKTKDISSIRKNLKLDDKKSLLVLAKANKNIYLSSRNLPGSRVTTVSELNTYDIMNASTVLFVESSLAVLQKED